MADVDATQLRTAFDADVGILPDGLVVGSGTGDWPDVLRAISAAGWAAMWNSDHSVVEIAHLGLSAREHDSFAVHPGAGLQINFFPRTEVLFDIDLRELNDQASVDVLCDVMRRVGGTLGKDVSISQEGDWEQVVFQYDHAADRFFITAST